MKIWGKYRGKVELIDTCAKGEAASLCGEYRTAFGSGWTIWAGLKRDEPGKSGHAFDETSHYKGY